MAKMNGGSPEPGRTQGSSAQQTVLVFQAGGALGAYQAGVYQALHESGVEPDWLIGISIGAVNASLIAGNKVGDRLDRLKEFWSRVEHSPMTGLAGSIPMVGPAI